MKIQEALTVLSTYHAWRIGDDEVHMQKPSEVTKAIETLLKYHIGDVNKMVRTVTDCNVSEIPTSHTKKEQLTSIEWLEEKAKEFAIDLDLLNYFEQAKEMHKNEIEDAYSSGRFDYEDYVKGIKLNVKQSKEYYQKTFKPCQ